MPGPFDLCSILPNYAFSFLPRHSDSPEDSTFCDYKKASTWESCAGAPSEQRSSILVFWRSPDTAGQFYFYLENVATRGRSTENRAVELIGHLLGEAFDFHHERYAADSKVSAVAKDYVTINKAFISPLARLCSPRRKLNAPSRAL